MCASVELNPCSSGLERRCLYPLSTVNHDAAAPRYAALLSICLGCYISHWFCTVAYASTSLQQYIQSATPQQDSELVFVSPTQLLYVSLESGFGRAAAFTHPFVFSCLFNTPLDGFDVVVKLKAKKLPRATEGLSQLTVLLTWSYPRDVLTRDECDRSPKPPMPSNRVSKTLP